MDSAHRWVSCIINETHKSLFSTTFSLKIDHTVLFTHLKIILLQYFQFQQNKRYPNRLFIWKWWLTTHGLSYQSCGQKNGEINLGPCSLLIDLSSMLDGYTILWAWICGLELLNQISCVEIWIYICVCVCVCIERERERESHEKYHNFLHNLPYCWVVSDENVDLINPPYFFRQLFFYRKNRSDQPFLPWSKLMSWIDSTVVE